MIVRLLRASSLGVTGDHCYFNACAACGSPRHWRTALLEHASIFLMADLFTLPLKLRPRSFILGAIAFSVSQLVRNTLTLAGMLG